MDPVRRALACLAVAATATFAAPAHALPERVSSEAAHALLRDPNRILLSAAQFDVRDGAPAPSTRFGSLPNLSDVEYWIVHTTTAPSDDQRIELEALGMRPLRYVPNHAYVVHGSLAQVEHVDRLPNWTLVGPYRPDFRIAEALATSSGPAFVALFETADATTVAELVTRTGATVHSISTEGPRPRLVVDLPAGGEFAVARIEGVEWIEPVGDLELRNDTVRWVLQSNQLDVTPLRDAGLLGQGQIIGHIDGPIFHLNCYFVDPDHEPGPDHRKIVAYRSEAGYAIHKHGTHTAGTLAGDAEVVGGPAGYKGMAPAARLSHTSFYDLRGVNGRPSNLYSLLKAANADGAHVHSNSWGESTLGKYTTWTVDCDAYTRDVEDDLVVFAIVNAGYVIAPENGKNVLAVGGTGTVPDQDYDGPGGLGPTFDGRRKPEVTAPGLGVRSATQYYCSVGLMTGTSVACPAVAGIATLVRQYYTDGFYRTGVAHEGDGFVPTGALLKATVINGAVDMERVDGYPSPSEGWGRVLIDDALYFPGDTRKSVVFDVRHAEGLRTGDSRRHFVRVGTGEPLKITMVFTDQPAALGTAFAPINDLDLEVVGPSGTFWGNAFEDGESAGGGEPDNLNNTERVIVRDPAPGTWEIHVHAPMVPLGPQGYAIHVAGNVSVPEMILDESGGGGETPTIARSVSSGDGLRFEAARPNPFTTSTTLELALPHAEHVTLAIFDVTGRAVATIVDDTLPAGAHRFVWSGRDANDSRVAPGTYFARTVVGGITKTRKVVLVEGR